MRRACLILFLALSAAYSQVQTPELDRVLSAAAQSLAVMPFDQTSTVTIHGRVNTLVWPQGTSGMLILETGSGGAKYAFSTALVRDMAKQGFTRFSLLPGEQITVSGVLAANRATIGPGFTAARADTITKDDGKLAFDRARLP